MDLLLLLWGSPPQNAEAALPKINNTPIYKLNIGFNLKISVESLQLKDGMLGNYLL
jgi:hypothetical protein